MKTDNELKCSGSCEKHIGVVKLVRVSSATHDWGTFYYCEEAIREDKSRGFDVKLEEEQK